MIFLHLINKLFRQLRRKPHLSKYQIHFLLYRNYPKYPGYLLFLLSYSFSHHLKIHSLKCHVLKNPLQMFLDLQQDFKDHLIKLQLVHYHHLKT